MKTTIDIPDPLLSQARQIAATERTTLRALIEEGLRAVVERRRRGQPFRLRDGSVGGEGLQPEFADGDRARIRAANYEGHGG